MKSAFTTATLTLGLAALVATTSQSDAATIFEVGMVGTTAETNNWPAAEPPPAAIDGANSKYLNFGELNTGFFVTPAAGPSVVTGLFLMTANDAAPRDPLTFSLYGTNTQTASGGAGTTFDLESGDFSPITLNQSTGLEVDPGRLSTPAVQPVIVNATEYTSYVLFFPTVRDPAAANSMQISEAQLTGTVGGTPQTITAAGDPIVGGQVIPEPGTLSLLSLLGLAALRRRR
ncbi:hypothetical protein BH23VER1_BH23VER1_25180 [soil metagenome]